MTREDLINRASALARMWATSSAQRRAPEWRTRLVADPAELDFAVKFLDLVARPEDPAAAARALERLEPQAVTFLTPVEKALLRAGQVFSPYLPRVVAPAARRWARRRARDILADADPSALTRHIATTLAAGYRPNLRLLGEAAPGDREARSRREEVIELLRRPDVDYVSLTLSSLAPHLSPWDVPGEAERAAERLRPIFQQAMASTPHKFLHLDMGPYRELALTVEAFERLLSEPEFMHLSAGITLQAYLPDTHEALRRLIAFATGRVQAGGAPIKVRLATGADPAMEMVEAELHGWALAPYPERGDADANYLRLLEAALRPEVSYALRLGVATHDLFPLAYAHLLAADRGVQAALDVEMLHGVAPGHAAAVQSEVPNPIVIYTPVVARDSFPAAVPYLVRRLHEAAAEHRYLHDHFTPDLDGQEHAFLAASAREPATVPRRSHTPPAAHGEFTPTPDADPALAITRAHARAAVHGPLPTHTTPALTGQGEVDDVVARAVTHAQTWRAVPAEERAATMRDIADELERRRWELVGVLAHEAGQTVTEADREVSTAVDAARYYARQAERLEQLAAQDGLEFTPDRVVLVEASRISPLAAGLGGVLAALAAGAAAVLAPAGQTPFSAHLGAQALHAGLRGREHSDALAQVVSVDDGEARRALVAHADVDSVILSGALATAQLRTSWRADRPRGPRIFAETGGKNSLIITPSADYDRALEDAVRSAFARAGQGSSAVSVLILVGSVATSPRFRRALVDAVDSAPVDWPAELSAHIGPLLAPAGGDVLEALTTLEPGEEWWVEPQQLDDAGQLWRPGVKSGVRPGSSAHLSAGGGPVLGIMAAGSLEDAIAWQNAPDYGRAGGIHSLDPDEIETWVEAVEVASAAINCPTTGESTHRHPRGGWKNSAVGPGAGAGGPNYLAQLGEWVQAGPAPAHGEVGPRVEEFLDLTTPWLSSQDRDWLRACARSDAHARDLYRTPVDLGGLTCEERIFRYRPGPRMTIRAGAESTLTEVLRLVAASLAAGVEAGVSIAPELFDTLPAPMRRAWEQVNSPDPDPPADPAPADPAPADPYEPNPGDEVAASPAPARPDPAPDTEPLRAGDGAPGVDTAVIPRTTSDPEGTTPDPEVTFAPGPAPEGVPAGVDLGGAAVGVIAGWRPETIEEFTTRASTWVRPGRVRSLDPEETSVISGAVSTSIAVLAGPALQSGQRELLGFLREQTVSRTRHRFGHVPAREAPGPTRA